MNTTARTVPALGDVGIGWRHEITGVIADLRPGFCEVIAESCFRFAIDRVDQGFFVFEEPIDGAGTNLGALCDQRNGGAVEAALGKELEGSVEQTPTFLGHSLLDCVRSALAHEWNEYSFRLRMSSFPRGRSGVISLHESAIRGTQ